MAKLTIPGPGNWIVPNGTYTPATYSGLGMSGTTLTAASRYGAKWSGKQVLRFNDGQKVAFVDLVFEACWRVWVSGGRYDFTRCLFRWQGVEGVMGGACHPLTFVGCVFEFNGYGPPWPGDSHAGDPSADHGVYFGFGTTGGRARGCIIRDCTGAGLKTNGDDRGNFCRDLLVENTQIWRCGWGGTPNIQLDCTRGARFVNVLIVAGLRKVGGENPTPEQRRRNEFTPGFLTAWGDGAPTGRGCDDIEFDRLTLWNRGAEFNLRLGGGTKGIVIRRSVLVLADAPLTVPASGQSYEEPRIEDSLIFSDDLAASDPRLVRCEVRPASEAAAYFAPGDDTFLPADPTSPYGWRPPDDPTGPPPEPPDPPEPPATVTCSSCSGTGKCATCQGSGVVPA